VIEIDLTAKSAIPIAIGSVRKFIDKDLKK